MQEHTMKHVGVDFHNSRTSNSRNSLESPRQTLGLREPKQMSFCVSWKSKGNAFCESPQWAMSKVVSVSIRLYRWSLSLKYLLMELWGNSQEAVGLRERSRLLTSQTALSEADNGNWKTSFLPVGLLPRFTHHWSRRTPVMHNDR